MRGRFDAATALAGLLVASGCDTPGAQPITASSPGAACTASNRFVFGVRSRLDLLFVVDDSPTMAVGHDKLVGEYHDLVEALEYLPGLDLHAAVVSTSMGAASSDEPAGCVPPRLGQGFGSFLHPARCQGLPPDQSFVISDGRIANFTGDRADVLACLLDVGVNGCRVPQPFAAARRALEKAADPLDPDNGGFRRRDATLAVFLLTNRDDCSFRLGPATPAPTPTLRPDRGRDAAALVTSPMGVCEAAEARGELMPIEEFNRALLEFAEPEQIVAAAVAGVPGWWAADTATVAAGHPLTAPTVKPACTAAGGQVAFPAPRLKSWLDTWPGSIFESLCASDLKPILINLSVHGDAGPTCLPPNVAMRDDGTPDCQVVSREHSGDGQAAYVDTPLARCDAHQTNYPCWRVRDNWGCPGGAGFDVCGEPTCGSLPTSPAWSLRALVSCSLRPPC